MTSSADFTVGNTITVAVAIYKQNWKRFLKLSLIAHLWLLVPVYGWARYFAIARYLCQLVMTNFSYTKINNLEDENYKLQLFISHLITRIIKEVTFFFLFYISIGITYPALKWLNSSIPSYISRNQIYELLHILCSAIIMSIPAIFILTGIFLTDLIVGTNKLNPLATIQASYRLTFGCYFKVFIVIFLCFLTTLPVLLVCMYSFFLLINYFLKEIGTNRQMIVWLISCYSVTSLLTLPLWQSTKTIIFYTLVPSTTKYDLNCTNL